MANQESENPTLPAGERQEVRPKDLESGSLAAAEAQNPPQITPDPTGAAFSDTDKTAVHGASIYALARGLVKNGIASLLEMPNFAFKQAKFVLAGTANMDHISKI